MQLKNCGAVLRLFDQQKSTPKGVLLFF